MNSEPPAPSKSVLSREDAQERQKRSAAARWAKLTQEEKSKQMRTVRLKKSRRKYVVTVVQDHNPDEACPFTVSVRSARHAGLMCDVRGKNLSGLLNQAGAVIFAREEERPPREE